MDDATYLDAGRPIFLVGFMGAGKTTVGRVLARRLKRQFIDLDDVIQKRAGLPIPEIFKSLGEQAFRDLEREAIQSLDSLTNVVIALGGGAYVAERNRQILRDIGTTVWIDCPLEMCLTRISTETSRPLLGSAQDMERLLGVRVEAYRHADIRIQAGRRRPGGVARAIMKALQDRSATPVNPPGPLPPPPSSP